MNLSIRKRHNHGPMTILGRSMLGAAAFLATVLAIRALPDLRRYLRMSTM